MQLETKGEKDSSSYQGVALSSDSAEDIEGLVGINYKMSSSTEGDN